MHGATWLHVRGKEGEGWARGLKEGGWGLSEEGRSGEGRDRKVG